MDAGILFRFIFQKIDFALNKVCKLSDLLHLEHLVQILNRLTIVKRLIVLLCSNHYARKLSHRRFNQIQLAHCQRSTRKPSYSILIMVWAPQNQRSTRKPSHLIFHVVCVLRYQHSTRKPSRLIFYMVFALGCQRLTQKQSLLIRNLFMALHILMAGLNLYPLKIVSLHSLFSTTTFGRSMLIFASLFLTAEHINPSRNKTR